jgi:pyridoxamine 5'-phosphate oxidase
MAADVTLLPPTPSSQDYAGQDPGAPIPDTHDPIALFAAWMTDARAHEPSDANAMSLATVDAGGMPDVRTVLLKDFGADGFTFYTNLESAKAHQLGQVAKAALCFHWKSLARQVRVRGIVEPARPDEADAYFASRARDSQLGAWASEQSTPLSDRETLKARLALFRAVYAEDETIPRPPFWGGFVLMPQTIEFWQAGAFRLHDRLAFNREAASPTWSRTRLNP